MIKDEHRDALLRFKEALLAYQASGSRGDRERASQLREAAKRAAVFSGVARRVNAKSPNGPVIPDLEPIPNALHDMKDASGKTLAAHAIEHVDEALQALEAVGGGKVPQQDAQQAETQATSGSRPRQNMTSDPTIDFAILTALEVERKAVCAAFGLTDDDRVPLGARVYWRGKLPLKTGEAYEIVVAQAPDMANVDAAILTNDTLRDWKPGAALLVGIAASTDEKLRLGDIVAGSEVYYYERGKVTGKMRTKPEPKMISADSTLWSRVSAVRAWDGEVAAVRPDGTKNRPMLHYGVIASGEKVIANAAVRDEIASGHRKILALEMESYGFSRAVWQSFERVRHLNIRGICDNGSEAKDDKWHKYAAAAAAAFTRHFLLDRPLEPRPR